MSDLGSPKNSVECSDHESDSLGKRKISSLVIDNEILSEVCPSRLLTSGSKQLKTECGGVSPGFTLTRDSSFQASGKKSTFYNLQQQNVNSYSSLGDQKSKMR